MYNKKVLIDALKTLGTPSTPKKYNFNDGGAKNTGLNEAPYKQVSVKPSNVAGKGLFADEPIKAGEIIGLSHIKSFYERGGQNYMKSQETPVVGKYYNHSDDAFNAGSIIEGNKRYLRALRDIEAGEEILGNYREDDDPSLESPDDFKRGGSLPRMPRKKNSRGYSRSLEATNKFFTENAFFAKPKSRKNKVYDPNSKYYSEGGENEIGALPKARNGITYVEDPNDPALLEYKERLRLNELAKQKKAEYYALLKEYGINPDYDNFYHYSYHHPQGNEAQFKDRWNDLYNWNAQYDPDYREGTHGYNTEVKYDSKGRRYIQVYHETSNSYATPGKRMYGNDMETMLNGFPMYNKPEVEVRYRPKEETPETTPAPSPIPVEIPEEEIKLPIRPIDEVVLPEPEMVTIKRFVNSPKNSRGHRKKKEMAKDYWKEVQVMSNDPAVDEWRKQLELGVGNNPNSRLLRFTEGAINPVIKKEGGSAALSQAQTEPESIETELTPEEITEYAKGGYIIEDVSTPPPNFASGLIKTALPFLKKTAPTMLDLRNLPVGFNPSELSFPLLINGSSGFIHTAPNRKLNDNLFHFAANMKNPLEAGRAFNIINQAFPFANPSILEPASLSLDSLNLLLNMGQKRDWDMRYADHHIPLNFFSEHNDLFGDLGSTRSALFQAIGSQSKKTGDEMVDRLNAYLNGRGIQQKAYLQSHAPGLRQIMIPNFQLTRKYAKGGAKNNPPLLGNMAKAIQRGYSPNLVKSIFELSQNGQNLQALNYLKNNYLRNMGSLMDLPGAVQGSTLDLPQLNAQQIEALLHQKPMLESDFLTQYSGYNPIQYDGGLPIVTGGLTGHKTSFQNFDRNFRGTGFGNQTGGVYFTTQPTVAAENAQISSMGGYGFNPNTPTFTPHISEAIFKNPDKFLQYNAPITEELAKSIGMINGIDPRNSDTLGNFETDLRNSFSKTDDYSDYDFAMKSAADALREKGIAGYFNPSGRIQEIVAFDEGDVNKIKQFELYKDLDDALIMGYLKAISKTPSTQTEAEKKLIAVFEEYLKTGNKQQLIDRKKGGALPPSLLKTLKGVSKLTPGNALRSTLYSAVNPASYNILQKIKAAPLELYNNMMYNDTRPFRVGMSLKHGAPELRDNMLEHVRMDLNQWNKTSLADQMAAIKNAYGSKHLNTLEDIGRRRLDAWAVGLKRPQEHNTLEQVGDNTFRMVDTEYTPMYLNELYNDLLATKIESEPMANDLGSVIDNRQFSPLEQLSRDQFRVKTQYFASNPLTVPYRLSEKDKIGYPNWNRTRHAQVDPMGLLSKMTTGTVYDNDRYGVMGGYNWKINEHPEGMVFQTNDLWDLNPFEKRIDPMLNTDAIKNKYLNMHYYKPFQNFEALRAVGGKPFNIQNNFLVDPDSFNVLRQWAKGGPTNPPAATACQEGYVWDKEKNDCVPLEDMKQKFTNWYKDRKLPFDEIQEPKYQAMMEKKLPQYNPKSSLLNDIQQVPDPTFTPVIANNPDVMGQVVSDPFGMPTGIQMIDDLKGDASKLNDVWAHEFSTYLDQANAKKEFPAQHEVIAPGLVPFEEGWGHLTGDDRDYAEYNYNYLTDPKQDNIHSLIFEERFKRNLKPDQVITEADINSWRADAEASGALDRNSPNFDDTLYTLFKLAKDNKALSDWFNRLASNDTPVSDDAPQYTKDGGSIDYELGDTVDKATMEKLKKLGYTFEQIK
jgi:hypothetical protein